MERHTESRASILAFQKVKLLRKCHNPRRSILPVSVYCRVVDRNIRSFGDLRRRCVLVCLLPCCAGAIRRNVDNRAQAEEHRGIRLSAAVDVATWISCALKLPPCESGCVQMC